MDEGISLAAEPSAPAEDEGWPAGAEPADARGPHAYEAMARLLVERGARMCFGVSGTSNFRISHALIEAGVTFVAARHECNAVSMADAYAKATGELTLVSVHAGPGLTNAVTGIGEAAKSRTPLVVLAGDVPASDVHSTFHIDQAALVRSVGAVPHRIHSGRSALADTERAVREALHDRRTVLLTLPTDVQYERLPAGTALPTRPPRPSPVHPDPGAVADLAERLDRAERPLVLAGRGAVLADAREDLVALADAAGALLATTLQGNGLFSGERWSLGISGGFASQAAADIIAESDLVVGFGATFTYWTTRHGTLYGPQTTVAQVDIDAARLGAQRPVDIALAGDAKITARALLDVLRARGGATRSTWRSAAMRERVRAADTHATPHVDLSTEAYLDPRTLSKAVDAILPAQRNLALDAGHFMAWPPRFIRVPDARASSMGASFQSIGLGLASAIGLALAQPHRPTVLGIGDGGYMMSLADLETAARLGLDLCILIYDDASYGAEVHPFAEAGYDTGFVRFPDLDLAGIARSVGAQGIVARTLADLEPLRDWVAAGAKGVFVVDAKISPHYEEDWQIHVTRGGGH